jgi:DNA ligase (NAD+)
MFDQKKLEDFTNKYLERVSHKPVSSLTQKEIQQAYESLIEIIGYHNWLYYITSHTIISDGQYDSLFAYLKEIETLQPDNIHPDSPTQKLTYQLQDEFFQAQHKIPLLSLENSYNAKDLADWNESLKKLYAKETIDQYSFICQPKYDGVSIELVYEHGVLTQAITRGD